MSECRERPAPERGQDARATADETPTLQFAHVMADRIRPTFTTCTPADKSR